MVRTTPGCWNTVFDLYRGMIIVNGPSMDHQVLQMLVESTVFEVVRWKDRLNNPTSAGWADSMVNVKVRNGADHIFEVQVVQKKMLLARKGLDGHEAYAQARGILEVLQAL